MVVLQHQGPSSLAVGSGPPCSCYRLVMRVRCCTVHSIKLDESALSEPANHNKESLYNVSVTKLIRCDHVISSDVHFFEA